MIEGTVMDDALANASSATSYRISRGLALAFPGKAVFETEEGDFDPWSFGQEGECEVTLAADLQQMAYPRRGLVLQTRRLILGPEG